MKQGAYPIYENRGEKAGIALSFKKIIRHTTFSGYYVVESG
jgi:hypothetical protein